MRGKTLKKLKLDDSSYDSIYEKAMQHLEKQAPWWSHREISDPGITLVEMWSLLSDLQSFYLDQVQESHYRKYLKLLGIAQDEGRFAWTWVSFEKVRRNTVLPEGTKLQAADMIFETEEEVKLTANSMVSFYLEKDETPKDGKERMSLMKRLRKTSFPLTAGIKRLFLFKLKKPLKKGEKIDLFVLLDETKKRNSAGSDYCMAKLVWEYWAQGQYRKANVIRDETCGLLYSGRVSLSFECAMEKRDMDEGYPIQCRIEEGAFDVPPVLYRISLNVVKVFQKNTLCKEEYISASPDAPFVTLRSYLAQTGRIEVYRRCGEDQWEECTQKCDIDAPVVGFRQKRYLHFKDDFRDEMTQKSDNTLKIVCSVQGVKESYAPCTITGVSSQQIALPWENIRRDYVELMLRQGDGDFRFCRYYRKDPEEDRVSNAWHWLDEKNVIEFGDGRHGDIPMAAKDGLRFTGLVLWEGDKGNVSIGKITRFEKPELFPDITCSNLMSGTQGRDRIRPSELFASLKEIIPIENRMITATDVKQIAQETPGLIIKDADVLWKDGKILVTVIPAQSLDNKYCIQKYIDEVKKHLEQYRLVTSRIEVVIGKGN